MPYVSEKQRRFFHTETARKKGITPAMVHEWDQESKGKDRPESAEKKGEQNFARQGVRPSAGFGADMPTEMPGYQQQFLNASSQKAQDSSAERFNAGQTLTMPITR